MKRFLVGALSLTVFVTPYLAYAEEITVSGNGEGSTSNVNVTQTQTTDVTQNNNAEITNNIEETANTGENEASGNSGDTSITTGDVSTNTTIDNSNINQSYVNTGCCGGDTNIKISGNGADSDSSVDYNNNGSTNINVNNYANINNTINGWANTGYNSANDNLGDTSIKTGSIKVIDNIRNSGINLARVSAGQGMAGDISVAITDNGANSDNSITLNLSSDSNVDVNNRADIINNSSWDLNTGGNEANGNNGDVSILTGDIFISTTIENTDVNTSWVDIDCCEENNVNPPENNPPAPPSVIATSNVSSSNAGPVAAVLAAQVLPVTGNYSMMIFMVGNILMFFLGWYLRLRSGRSPNYLFAR